uniref:BTB domain-containing protein n=1 Tax=Ditylenchus dipsaci TaxID=166011 RepID=A0A915EM96_9BILA
MKVNTASQVVFIKHNLLLEYAGLFKKMRVLSPDVEEEESEAEDERNSSNDEIFMDDIGVVAHISAYIYTTRKQYVELLDCCLLNKLDQAHVFSVAQDLLAHLRDNELDSVKNHLQSNINKLNAIDSYRTAELVLDNFPDFFGQTERISFVLLKNCFESANKMSYKMGGDLPVSNVQKSG